MATSTPKIHQRPSRRTRLIKRRFSSVSATGTPRKFKSSSTRSLRNRIRQASHSLYFGKYPSKPSHSSETSDIGTEEEEDVVPFPLCVDDPFVSQDERRTFHYASLPPTPIIPSTPRLYTSPPPASPVPSPPPAPQLSRSPSFSQTTALPFSLWDYVREELLATDFDSHQELKWDRVSNFLNIPLAIEKIITFGFVLCLDSFLYTFTILPIRFTLALFRFFCHLFSSSSPPLPPSQKADILRMLLLVVSICILFPLTDASKIYHSIRGQDTIKLYVIFNALEIADRLCASIGQDVLDCLFSRSTLEPLSHRMPVTQLTFRPFWFFLLATLYTVAHTLVMVYQMLALNVAVNSYDHALLTLLVSNQFVEIKGSVFKKFEKDNLFQITCSDIVERFTLALMLFVVAFRNLIELGGSEFHFTEGFVLPQSYGWFGHHVLWTISYPVLTVMTSEMLVDWLKHAFITKFNHIRPSVYERYTDVLCRDLSSGSAVGRRGARKHAYVDQSPLVARRLGFAALPLAVLAVLIGSQSATLIFALRRESLNDRNERGLTGEEIVHYVKWAAMGFGFWLCAVGVKVIIGVNLVSYATRRWAGMEARQAEDDAINHFGRDPIGEGKEEQIYNHELKALLDNGVDDAAATSEMGERKKGDVRGGASGGARSERGGSAGRRKRERVKLEDLTRFTMVKRIW